MFNKILCVKFIDKKLVASSDVTAVMESVERLLADGDNEFFGLRIANKYYTALFYQEDFKDLTHPFFFRKHGKRLAKKRGRKGSRSQSASANDSEADELSQLERTSRLEQLGAPVDVYKRQRIDSGDSEITQKSALSAMTDKSGRAPRYISKKRKAAIQDWMENERQRRERERQTYLAEEEEWRNSKHI